MTEGDQSGEAPESKNTMPPNETQPENAAEAAEGDAKRPLTDEDPTQVKFISNDAKLELGDSGRAPDLYPALTKAELMQYAADPFWVRLRWALFILFWLVWLAMLVVSVIIIVVAPKCPSPAPKQWWQKAPVYEVYVKSFKDSNDDGTGDLKGIESELDYLSTLGIGSVWLSPIYASPQKDNGYDVSDFRSIQPEFGTLQDFKDLVAGLHERGIKLIMDFIPNHTSEDHPWFQKSLKSEEPYTDFYVWKSGRTPTNWKSVFGGSAWKYRDERRASYLHQFYDHQPDLNLRNPKVVEELEAILDFWLDLGVDGFRMDAVAHLFEEETLSKDEGVVPGKSDYESVDHKHTYNLPEVLDVLKKFRQVLDKKSEEDDVPRIMLTEAYLPNKELVKYYGTNFTEHSGDISQLPLNFGFISDFNSPEDVTAAKLKSVIADYLSILPSGAWPNFNLGNHDKPRVSNRFGEDLVDAMNIIYMLLPGTPITYYGEEIGMKDGEMSSSDVRARYRTPMQWNANANAGFTSGQAPWLKVNEDYQEINVDKQSKMKNSHLKVYRTLAEMRHHKSVLFGDIDYHVNGTLFAYNRVKKGNPGYLVAVNLGEETIQADVSKLKSLPGSGTVHLRSAHEEEGIEKEEDGDDEGMGKTVAFDSIPLRPKEAIVVTFVPNIK